MLTVEGFIREREKKYCDEIPGSEYDYRSEDVVNFGLLILNPENWYDVTKEHPEIGQRILARHKSSLKIYEQLISNNHDLAFISDYYDKWIPLPVKT